MNDPTEEWLLQPVEAGMCRYESLVDGTLSLHDIARMNEYLAVQAENRARIQEAQEDSHHGH
jgi:hypothetical protein